MHRGLVRAFLILLALAAVSTLASAACGGDDNESTASPTKAGASPTPATLDISNVPELKDKKLTLGSDVSYAPMEFYKEGTQTADGLDVDLANAMGQAMGVSVEFVNSGFDGLIGALGTSDFDAIMSSMTVTDKRKQEIDFVPYLNVGTGIVVPAANPKNIKSLTDLCGLTVAVQAGTIQLDLVNAQNDKCTNKINVVTFDTNPLAVEDLKTGGADANLSDFPVSVTDAQSSGGALKALDSQIEPSPYGIGVRKTSTDLKTALGQALIRIKQSGDYDKILQKWGLSSAALP